MRYQIYLNKTTSEAIEKMAKHDGMKPNTYIKNVIESLIAVTLATIEATEKEARKYGGQQDTNAKGE